jgi:hypothetical protein
MTLTRKNDHSTTKEAGLHLRQPLPDVVVPTNTPRDSAAIQPAFWSDRQHGTFQGGYQTVDRLLVNHDVSVDVRPRWVLRAPISFGDGRPLGGYIYFEDPNCGKASGTLSGVICTAIANNYDVQPFRKSIGDDGFQEPWQAMGLVVGWNDHTRDCALLIHPTILSVWAQHRRYTQRTDAPDG